MTGPSEHDQAMAARSRRVGVVIAVTVVAWLVLQYAGVRLGIPVRLMGLADLVALAILAWAMFVAVGMWRARRDRE